MRRSSKDNWSVFRSSFLAGSFIGMAGLGYVRTGGDWLGIILFSLGLVGCVWYNLYLYTGFIGFAKWREFDFTHIILLGNILGTLAVAAIARECFGGLGLEENTAAIIQARLSKSWIQALLLGIPCGLLMTFAVTPLKPWVTEGRTWIPLFFAVPMFLVCGFLHSIADSFYFWMMGKEWLIENIWQVLLIWGSVVVGNFIGCNIPRILINDRR